MKISKSPKMSPLYNDDEEAFCRTVVANRDFEKGEITYAVKPIFDAWVGRQPSTDVPSSASQEQTNRIKYYSDYVVSRCFKRAFFITKAGYFGLGPQKAKVGDLVCIVYGAEVAFILRKPDPRLGEAPGSFIGEAYVHGIMQGEYLGRVKDEEFSVFWIK